MLHQLSLYFRQLVGVSEMAKILHLSEQRVRQLCDSGALPSVRIPAPDGDRFSNREDVERLALERQVQQLLSGARKRGPKGPRRPVAPPAPKPTDAYQREFEAATA